MPDFLAGVPDDVILADDSVYAPSADGDVRRRAHPDVGAVHMGVLVAVDAVCGGECVEHRRRSCGGVKLDDPGYYIQVSRQIELHAEP